MNEQRLIGVTVLPEYLQSEGVEAVLDNLVARAGVTAVATSPYVMEEADAETGGREPPIDAGAGSVRLLDRPLWNKRELWVRTAPSFVPNQKLYRGLRYQPLETTELTDRQGPMIGRFIEAARARGLKVYLQVQSAIPPGYRVQFGGPTAEDTPRLPDGQIPQRRVDNNGSLASPHIVDYEHALLRDLCEQYPTVNGIRCDWPEYPPYSLDSAFLDFSEHARRAAGRFGYDFESMRHDAGRLYQKLHGGLTDHDLNEWLAVLNLGAVGGDSAAQQPATEPGQTNCVPYVLEEYPGVADLLRFKRDLVEQLLAGFKTVLSESSGGRIKLAPSAFPPPWSYVSGMDYARAANHCDELGVKLYGMHWAMMLRFYGDQLREANPGLSSKLLARLLVRLLDIADDEGRPQLEDYSYPEPDEPHPVGRQAQIRKITQAQQLAGDMPIHVLAHGYGPVDDLRRRIEVAYHASPHGFWVNRYGYLSDQKLDTIGQVGRTIG